MNARSVLRVHGRSFHWASRLLGPGTAERAARLYRFCREVDDAVDRCDDPQVARERVAALRNALIHGAPADATTRDFLELCSQARLDPSLALDLLDGVEQDIGAVRMPDEPALLRYSYRVAGVVGIWMAELLGARDRVRARPFAIDLGIAMQLTNIARDVGEDARRDRVYLPPAWTSGRDLEPQALLRGEPDARAQARAGQLRALALAERYYASGSVGLRHLPSRNRLAIAVAARVYRAIGARVSTMGERSLEQRARVSGSGKAVETARATVAWLSELVSAVGPGPHETALHAALTDLPRNALDSEASRCRATSTT
jgi:phytoene synthase